MLSIHQRPFAPQDRSEAGHWEGDLIVGRVQGSVIGTLVERQTRTIRLLHLPARDADTLHAAVLARMNDLPGRLVRSITWDQGKWDWLLICSSGEPNVLSKRFDEPLRRSSNAGSGDEEVPWWPCRT